MKEISSSAMVVGAGISGVRSALDLAEMGYQVTVIDKAPNLGGVLTQLDNQFPDDHCGMCKMLPLVDRDSSSQFCLRKGFFHERIELLLSTELINLEGEPGRFKATLRQRNYGVNPDLCIGCGDCVEVCPEETLDLFNLGLGNHKAIYLPIPHNIPNKYQINFDACTKCGNCLEACPTNAISISGEGPVEQEILLETGTVILSCGTEYFDPKAGKDTYGYGSFPDVVTSREFERILSGTGPTKGVLTKPSDGKPIKKIAWFQCVGSRDSQTKSELCSSVCCMHAIKEARLVKKQSAGEIDCTIFYMDMRTFGKSFQRYRDEAESEYGLNFNRARIHTVGYDETKSNLFVHYLAQDGVKHNDEFDMIVLSIGQKPSSAVIDLAEATGVSVNQWGFCQTQPFSSTATEKEGVLISGSVSGLKDISDSVIQASAAALNASRVLAKIARKSTEEMEEEELFRNVTMEPPRILTVICDCGKASTEHINQDILTKNLKKDPSVVEVVFIKKTCTQDGWLLLKEQTEEIQPNRILVGACLPYAYIRKFKELAEEIKLHPALIDVVDLRTSGFNSTHNEALQNLVESTLKAGVSKLKRIDPSPAVSLTVTQRALVVGGGISGMTAALAIADNGYEVDLVENNDFLGGNLSWIEKTIEGHQTAALLEDRISRIQNNKMITLFTQSQITSVFGEAGRFFTVLTRQDEQDPLSLEHGTVVIATGGQEAVTESCMFGKHDTIITQKQFALKISDSSLDPKMLEVVVMMQCVDSRKEPRNYCSRICCVSALKNALLIKKESPDTSVFIFYRDLMSFGANEVYYKEARNQGVVFIQYNLKQEPEVEIVDGKVQITAYEPILGREIQIQSDLLVLATGVVPTIPADIVKSLRIKIDVDGFFQEAESKWRPVDSLKEGIFACGLAHSPRNITESITTAEAAASRAVRILKDKKLASGKIVAEIRPILCSKCERCISACPYEARTIHPETGCIEISPLMCQGCGSCAAVCPNSASILAGFQDQQMLEIVDSALSGFNLK
ncbi:FAD-dependent oxidoreductase [bacterium]|nr:FAD-dependent oxidoreductase [bacterium]